MVVLVTAPNQSVGCAMRQNLIYNVMFAKAAQN